MRARVLGPVVFAAMTLLVSGPVTRAHAASSRPTPSVDVPAEVVRPLGECTAGIVCGSVFDYLPSYYTVQVARFGTGSSRCVTWNEGTYNCTIYNLPSGKHNSDIGVRDADGFTVSSEYFAGGGLQKAWSWTRIHDDQTATCTDKHRGPDCFING